MFPIRLIVPTGSLSHATGKLAAEIAAPVPVSA